MKWKTKPMLLLLVTAFSFNHSNAQLKLPSLGNADVKNALEKVIADFPKEFSTLKGEVIANNPQTVEYESLLKFKSAEQNTITQYSGKSPVYSWQATTFTHEEFDATSKKYNTLYKQLKGMNITLNRDYNYSLTGDYEKPDESKKFCSTVFRLLPNASNLPKVKVELSMQYEFPEWKIYLMVYQKEKEDNERGKVED